MIVTSSIKNCKNEILAKFADVKDSTFDENKNLGYGEDYKYNFKYSILEVCNMNLGNDYIIERETHWKEILLTRQFGLNRN